jgi:hypothetical protein
VSASDHADIEAPLAVDALDGLEPADADELRSRMAAHGDCDRCRAMEAGFRETAALLADSLAPSPVDPGMVDRILAAAPRAATAVTDELADRRSHRGRARLVGAVAATIVVAVVASVAVIRPWARTTAVVAWRERVVTFSGPAIEGELAMAYVTGHRGVAVWGSGLPDPGAGKTYELWMISGTIPTSGGCLHPTDGRVGAFVRARVGSSDLMAVTVEPDSCPTAPTAAPVLTASLS